MGKEIIINSHSQDLMAICLDQYMSVDLKKGTNSRLVIVVLVNIFNYVVYVQWARNESARTAYYN